MSPCHPTTGRTLPLASRILKAQNGTPLEGVLTRVGWYTMHTEYRDPIRVDGMGSQSENNPLVSFYERRIGAATTANEVAGYWAFLVGVVLGLLGLGIYAMTDATTMGRGVAYAVAAAAPAFLMTGAVLRFPLRTGATYIVGAGGLLTLAAVGWFLVVFPEGWSTTSGHTGVIITYIGGLAVMGIAGVTVPLAPGKRDTSDDDALTQAKTDAASARRATKKAQRERDDANADQDDLAANLEQHRKSESQFEIYEDDSSQWRWRLRHRSGAIIATSKQSYGTQNEAQNSMQAVRRDAFGATVLAVEVDDETDDAGAMVDDDESQGTFEVYVDEGDEHRWRLRHDNGKIIAHAGEGYASRNGVEHSIERIKSYVKPAEYLEPDPTAIEIYRGDGGEWRWRLQHRNGTILASSGEGYADRGGARRVIDRLRSSIDEADIEIYEDDAGEFRWRLSGDDTKVKLASSGYETREAARDAVERVRTFLPEADLIDVGEAAFEIYEDEGGDHRWRLRHRNGNLLANGGQGYADRNSVFAGIESVKRDAPTADIEEVQG